jgi:hypothetical protein
LLDGEQGDLGAVLPVVADVGDQQLPIGGERQGLGVEQLDAAERGGADHRARGDLHHEHHGVVAGVVDQVDVSRFLGAQHHAAGLAHPRVGDGGEPPSVLLDALGSAESEHAPCEQDRREPPSAHREPAGSRGS